MPIAAAARMLPFIFSLPCVSPRAAVLLTYPPPVPLRNCAYVQIPRVSGPGPVCLMAFAATRRSGLETTIGKFAGFQSPDGTAGFELSCSLATERAVL